MSNLEKFNTMQSLGYLPIALVLLGLSMFEMHHQIMEEQNQWVVEEQNHGKWTEEVCCTDEQLKHDLQAAIANTSSHNPQIMDDRVLSNYVLTTSQGKNNEKQLKIQWISSDF